MSRRHSNVDIQKQVIVISLVIEFNYEYLTNSYPILTLFFIILDDRIVGIFQI